MSDQDDLKPKGRQGDVSGKALIFLGGISAGRCQFDGCNEDLTRHLVAGSRSANKGYVAHIIGSSEDGPRGDSLRSHMLARNPENVMLLCDGCHREIDREHPADYPEDRLRGMKRSHEAWVSRAVGLKPDSQSHILRFTNRIEANETAIPLDDCVVAMRGIGKTPASFEAIDLKLGLPGHQDTDDVYWAVNRGICEPSTTSGSRDISMEARSVTCRFLVSARFRCLSNWASCCPICTTLTCFRATGNPLPLGLGRWGLLFSARSLSKAHREPVELQSNSASRTGFLMTVFTQLLEERTFRFGISPANCPALTF